MKRGDIMIFPSTLGATLVNFSGSYYATRWNVAEITSVSRDGSVPRKFRAAYGTIFSAAKIREYRVVPVSKEHLGRVMADLKARYCGVTLPYYFPTERLAYEYVMSLEN